MCQTAVVEKIKTHILCSVTCFESRAVYEIMWENLERGAPQMAIRRMRIACWIPKATNTHPGCVIVIAFPPQLRLQEHASLLRHTYSTLPLVKNSIQCTDNGSNIDRNMHQSQNKYTVMYSNKIECIFTVYGLK